ncbi:MAG TPA: hypothetical protein VGU74_09170 [Gemmatimonadales bacterium]|nr:hypothetical protein [Gemmatimonadales bacterium]
MTAKVGLIVGREWSFPPKFIEEVNRRDAGVVADVAKLGPTAMDTPGGYAVLIDRISHEVPFYRSYLKYAVLQGVTVVNNPFMWTADDKFFGAALATKLGIASPKTLLLPNKEYIPAISHQESLRNLVFPLDWDAVVQHVGLPCILKDAHGGGWKDVYICRTREELLAHYDGSGLRTMIVQEFIDWQQFVRCICLGQRDILPIHYDPKARTYIVDPEYLSPELRERIVTDSRTLVTALGYDMNSIEWAVKDGVPYAIDFMNPAPDFDINSLTPEYFEWVVQHMADLVIRLAKRKTTTRKFHWETLFKGRTRSRASSA